MCLKLLCPPGPHLQVFTEVDFLTISRDYPIFGAHHVPRSLMGRELYCEWVCCEFEDKQWVLWLLSDCICAGTARYGPEQYWPPTHPWESRRPQTGGEPSLLPPCTVMSKLMNQIISWLHILLSTMRLCVIDLFCSYKAVSLQLYKQQELPKGPPARRQGSAFSFILLAETESDKHTPDPTRPPQIPDTPDHQKPKCFNHIILTNDH